MGKAGSSGSNAPVWEEHKVKKIQNRQKRTRKKTLGRKIG